MFRSTSETSPESQARLTTELWPEPSTPQAGLGPNWAFFGVSGLRGLGFLGRGWIRRSGVLGDGVCSVGSWHRRATRPLKPNPKSP